MTTASGAAPAPRYHGPDFRTYPPEELTDADGRPCLVQVCEERVAGRWEGFVSVVYLDAE